MFIYLAMLESEEDRHEFLELYKGMVRNSGMSVIMRDAFFCIGNLTVLSASSDPAVKMTERDHPKGEGRIPSLCFSCLG